MTAPARPPRRFRTRDAGPPARRRGAAIRRAARALALAALCLASTARADEPGAGIIFRDVTGASGVQFRYDAGAAGRRHLPEIMGGGVALLDADGDGRLDIYLCNGGPIGPDAPGADASPCRLFLNLGGMRFREAAGAAGAPGPAVAMGAAVGDYDGDGRADLLVTGYRSQRLYRNRGGGRFEDVTRSAGLESARWSTSAAFGDLDGDGDLDLYVAGYVDYDPATAPFCAAPDGRRDYCGPEEFPAQGGRLYRNNGDGAFTDVSAPAGIERVKGRGLGVLIAELTGDERPDLYVANDGGPCFLFANRGALHFEEVGEAVGAARDGLGNDLAGMGVALGDLGGDGRLDLAVTNFLGRSTIAFEAFRGRNGALLYRDAGAAMGLAAATRPVLGFGIAIEDFDGDGRPDLIQVNGHVLDRERLGTPLVMRPTLLRGSKGRLVDASASGGGWFARPRIGRGLAVGDLDGDGRPDLVVNALDAPASLLRNESRGGRFAALEPSDERGRPLAGATVTAWAGGRRIVRQVVGGGSYLSASQHRLFLGLGPAGRLDRVEVAWPWRRGRVEAWTDLPAGMVHRLRPGSGEPPGPSPAERRAPGPASP